MPELPEVETTREGLAPLIVGARVTRVLVREPRLRWPIPKALPQSLQGETIRGLARRAKYLLMGIGPGTVLIHLGMSGSLRVVPPDTPAGPHDHLDLLLDRARALRLRDPRRFGAILWTEADPMQHPLLCRLGPEPLEEGFDGRWLYDRARGRRLTVKSLLMDSRVVAGVGNIYANEALFQAGIHPARAAGRVSAARFEALARAVREVLEAAIQQGGTTLRDFVSADGQPGYFRQRLQVYDRAGEPCTRCATPILQRTIGQRSSFYCPRCQR